MSSPLRQLQLSDRRSWESEAENLLKLVDHVTHHIPNADGLFARWRDGLNELTADTGLDDFTAENQLDRLSMDFRLNWMRVAHTHVDGNLKSPPAGSRVVFPMGGQSKHPYERLSSPKMLEEKCYAYRPIPDDWRSRHLLFRSGMAAISAFLQNLRPHFFGNDCGEISLDFFGGYFETQRAFELFRSPLFSFQRHGSKKDFLRAVEEGDSQVIFFEPVSYDWEMEALNFDHFMKALRRRKRLPEIIVVDTTIVGDTFPVEAFVHDLPGDPPPVIVQISSGLKLDQEGLEFANVGILSVYWSGRNADQKEQALTFVRKMRQNRKITGVGLSIDETALLDSPWFLQPENFSQHCRRIFDNNRMLAEAVAPVARSHDGIFSHVSHPCLSNANNDPWAVAPFVVFHLHEKFDTEENHARLTEYLFHTARLRNLNFREGMSFGFRGHRFEIIKPREILHPNGNAKGVFKVAMGAWQEASRDEIIKLLTRLAKSSDFFG